MNPVIGTTNSPKDRYLNARRARRNAVEAHLKSLIDEQITPTALAVELAKLAEEDAADVLNLSNLNGAR